MHSNMLLTEQPAPFLTSHLDIRVSKCFNDVCAFTCTVENGNMRGRTDASRGVGGKG